MAGHGPSAGEKSEQDASGVASLDTGCDAVVVARQLHQILLPSDEDGEGGIVKIGAGLPTPLSPR